MNNKKEGSIKNRREILIAVGRALSVQPLTKAELAEACPNVVIDNNTLEMLRNSGAVTVTRGRYAKISLACDPENFFIHLGDHLKDMKRNCEKEEAVEKRILTAKEELKAAFRRAKAETAAAKAEIEFVYEEISKLEKENAILRGQLEAIKAILKG